ncbi:MAG: folate-binding protein YgfZ [Roseibium sp.]
MPTSTFVHLTDRALIRVSGEEAHHFLQNLVTLDIDVVDQKGAGSAALLTPQGKIQFDFLIFKDADGYLLDTPKEIAADLLKRLTFYRLRAKVTLELLDEDTGVFASLGGTKLDAGTARIDVEDPRLAALGRRIIGSVSELSGGTTLLEDYDRHRIALGVPEGIKDYDYTDIFPHDADMDQLGGVSFQKGCYVGQEVVSRVHHRGTARKRFVLIESDTSLPEKATSIVAKDKSVGEIGSSTSLDGKFVGLALLRLDKVHQAIDNGSPIFCGDAVVTVSLPEWAGFGWPETSTAD